MPEADPPVTRARPLPLLLLLAALAACSAGEPPASSLEVAAPGAHSAALAADGRHVAIGALTQGGSLWRLDPDERQFNWNHAAGAASALTAVAFSPEGRFALSVEGDTLVLWDALEGPALGYFRAPAAVLAAALGPEGRYALLGLEDGNAVLFDARAGGVVRTLVHGARVLGVAMDRSGTRAVTGSADRNARLWNLDDGQELQRWSHDAEVRLVALAADGSRALSVAKYDRAVVWDARSGQPVADLPTWNSRIVRGETFTAAAFAADGTRLLTGTTDGRVQLWEVSPMRERASWKLPRRDDWKRAGSYLLAVGFGAGEEEFLLGVSADGFIHRLRVPPAAR
jgi:WD40 repeat protein